MHPSNQVLDNALHALLGNFCHSYFLVGPGSILPARKKHQYDAYTGCRKAQNAQTHSWTIQQLEESRGRVQSLISSGLYCISKKVKF